MSSLNQVNLIGNLGADPEVRQTQSGDIVTTLSIATSENWTDQAGQKQSRTEWHRVVIWKRLAEIARDYLRKGSRVFVSGELRTRKWQDREGRDRWTTEVVLTGFGGRLILLDRKGEGVDPVAQQGAAQPQQAAASQPTEQIIDDDIPF